MKYFLLLLSYTTLLFAPSYETRNLSFEIEPSLIPYIALQLKPVPINGISRPNQSAILNKFNRIGGNLITFILTAQNIGDDSYDFHKATLFQLITVNEFHKSSGWIRFEDGTYKIIINRNNQLCTTQTSY